MRPHHQRTGIDGYVGGFRIVHDVDPVASLPQFVIGTEFSFFWIPGGGHVQDDLAVGVHGYGTVDSHAYESQSAFFGPRCPENGVAADREGAVVDVHPYAVVVCGTIAVVGGIVRVPAPCGGDVGSSGDGHIPGRMDTTGYGTVRPIPVFVVDGADVASVRYYRGAIDGECSAGEDAVTLIDHRFPVASVEGLSAETFDTARSRDAEVYVRIDPSGHASDIQVLIGTDRSAFAPEDRSRLHADAPVENVYAVGVPGTSGTDSERYRGVLGRACI